MPDSSLPGPHPRFGEIAVDRGILRPEQVEECLREQEERRRAGEEIRLGQILMRRGWLTSAQFVEILGCQGQAAIDSMGSPTRIGKYVLKREIARGGMGIVYEGEDPELNRRVALKVVRNDGENGHMLKRFHREATIAASLRHPNIVDVHEVGEATDAAGTPVHYIVMEFVEGQTLADLIRYRRPPRAELIRILADVTRAVAAAHEKGVIHRDLKPANVLVDTSGRVALTDFGLARAESITERLTRSQAVLGTPHYMAPEQVEGRTREIDPRTDVYALGVILYEILTGRVPFADETPAKLYSQIVHQEPTPPTRHDPTIKKDLEIICLKALEKDPRRRYASAEELGKDLARFVAGEEIEARPPSRIHKIVTFFRRRRAIIIAAAAGLAAVAAVAGFLGPRWLREKRERERIARESETERAALSELGALWMEVVLAKQGLYQSGENPGRVLERIGEVVERVDRFVERHPGRPQGFYVRARGRLYLGELDSAEADLERAVALDATFAPGHALLGQVKIQKYNRAIYGDPRTKEKRGQESAPLLEAARESLARGGAFSIEKWGLPRTREDDVAETVARALTVRHVDGSQARAVEILREADRKERSEVFCNLIGAWAATPDEKIEWQTCALAKMPHYAKAYYDRGTARYERGDLMGALQDFDQALAIQPRSIIFLLGRGGIRWAMGQGPEAIRDFDQALELDGRCAMAYVSRGRTRRAQGNVEAALRDFDRAIEIDPRHVEAYYNRGHVRFTREDLAGALADFDKALEIFPRYAEAFYGRSLVRWRKSEWAAALDDVDQAIRLDATLAEAFVHRGNLRAERGDRGGALQDFDRAIEINPRLADAYRNRGDLHRDSGDSARAIEDYDKALEIRPNDAGVLNDRGMAREAARDVARAIADFTKALEADPRYDKASANRGAARMRQGDDKGAREDFEKALKINPRCIGAYVNRGMLRQVSGDLTGAIADYDQALALDAKVLEAWVNRGMAKQAQGDLKGALADLTHALENAPAQWPYRARVEASRKRVQEKIEKGP